MNIKNFLWVIPFLSFTFGYWIMHHIMHIPEITIPHLVGKHVYTVLPIVTDNNLNLRLIDQKEEIDLPEGIILNQTPAAGTIIKQNQPIFIVTTKKPPCIHAPQWIGYTIKELQNQLKPHSISTRIYYLPHIYPEQQCFAQSPHHNEPLENNKMILYISSGNNKPIIWPDFACVCLQEVLNFLEYYQIKPYIINDSQALNNRSDEYMVIDQRPFAGTLLTLDQNQPLSVQLRVASRR